jgi:glycosyltransferase involved in cell wall biosynthesis
MNAKPLSLDNRPLRVTYVADAWNVHTHRWVKYFQDRGCECKVVSYRDWEIPGAEVYVHSLPPAGIMRVPLFKQLHTLSDYSRVRARLRWADIVHVHFIYRFRFNLVFKNLPRLIVSTWGKDVIRDTDEPEPESEAHWKSYVLRQATILTATSRFLAERTKEYAPKGKTIQVIPFGVDLSQFDPELHPRRGGTEKPYRIGFLKHLRTKYGPDTLIEATLILRDRGYPIRTLLAGEGEDEDELRRLAKEKGVGRIVDFVGRIPHEEVPAFLASLDVFCMPSRWESETFGVAAVEAQAMEVPVVATTVGGVPEAVDDGKSGVLVPPNHPDAIADAIGGLLDDPDRRRRMGQAGREFVRARYDWIENASRMEKIYRSLIER